MQTYTIVAQPGGTFRVRKGRSFILDDFEDEDAALKHVKTLKAPDDRVVKEDEDGYRVPVTRKRWRR
jgi:hypothetical protein